MYCAYFIVVLCRSTYVRTMARETYRNVRTYVQNHSTLLAEKIKYTILFYTDSSDYVGMVCTEYCEAAEYEGPRAALFSILTTTYIHTYTIHPLHKKLCFFL